MTRPFRPVAVAQAGCQDRSTRPSTCRGGWKPTQRAPIFARVSGYLKSWSVDIGARVKAGAGDRRDRGAGPRPAVAAGARRSREPAGQRQAVGSDLEPAQDAGRLELRLGAGDRRAHRRPRQQERGGQVRAGQCRAAGSARRLQEDHRAVRRHRHRARHRRRRADQCRRRHGTCDVRGLRHHASCASTSTCRRTTCRRSGSAPRP